MNKQIEFLLLELYRRGIDPTDFLTGALTAAAGVPPDLAGYLELVGRRREARATDGTPACDRRLLTQPLAAE